MDLLQYDFPFLTKSTIRLFMAKLDDPDGDLFKADFPALNLSFHLQTVRYETQLPP